MSRTVRWFRTPVGGILAAAAMGAAAGDETGFNIHFTAPKPGEMETLAATGVQWVRMDLTWGATERRPGEYDFSAYDRLVAAMAPHRLRALWILDYGNRLYDGGDAPRTEEGRAAFARWAAAAVVRYRGQGHLWEIWNEPNLRQFWKPEPNVAHYVALARAAARAIRDAAPGERIVGPATSGFDWQFLEACFRGGVLEDWHGVTVHPYRRTEPETAVADYGRLRDLIATHAPAGRAVPILSGEWGYSAVWRGFDADRQGRYLPRQWMVNAACGVPLSIWYDWRDDGLDPAEPEHHFGTVRHPWRTNAVPAFEPKPAWRAAATFNRNLGGYRFERRCALPRHDGDSSPDDWVLLFRGTNTWRLAAWTRDPGGADLRLPATMAGAAGESHLGDVVQVDFNAVIRVTAGPVYLPVGAEAARELSRPAPWDWSDGRVTDLRLAAGVETNTIVAVVEKTWGPPMRAALRVRQDGAPHAADVHLPAGGGLARVDVPPLQRRAPATLELVRDGVIIARGRAVPWEPMDGFDGAAFRIRLNSDGRPPPRHSIAAASTLASGLSTGRPIAALRIAVTTETGYAYFPVQPAADAALAIPGRPAGLGLWVRRRGDECSVTCRIEDRSGEVFQASSRRLSESDVWSWVHLELFGPGGLHWGGDKNGQPDLPLKWQAMFLIDREHGRPCATEVEIARPALLYE